MIGLPNRKLYLILFFTLFSSVLSGCRQTIDARQLEKINGLYYKLNDNDPFTGTVINNISTKYLTFIYPGNCTINYKNGEMDGDFICYSRTGEIKIAQMRLKANLRHGTEKVWDATTGALKWKIEWNNGKHHGVEEQYNPLNGKLIEEIHWDNDNKVGTERIWNLNGDVLLKDLYWINGKQTGYSIYRDHEDNFKDGKLDGINRRFELIGSFSEYQDLYTEVRTRGAGECSYMLLPHYVSLEETYQNGELISSVTKYKDKEHELAVKQIEIDRLADLEQREKQRKLNENMNY